MADLITLEIYKQAKAITGAKDDQRLDIIVSSVNQLVKTYCGNSLIDYATTPYTEYISPDYSGNQITLTEFPVLAISEVWERPQPSESYVQLLDDGTDYSLDRRSDTLVREGAYWMLGTEAVQVVYTAGYASTPPDLTLALIDLIQYYYKDEYKATRQLGSASINNNPNGTIKGNIGFPDHIKRVLDLYRQI